MSITEARAQWIVRYHKAWEMLRTKYPKQSRAWIRHHARTIADTRRG